MKNRNTQLSILIVKEYAKILYRYFREGRATAAEITIALADYMQELGLPREVVMLAFCAYLSLL